MKISYCGVIYECNVAVKCENDKYIKLYDENGAEIAAFHNIADFSAFTVVDGEFVAPCDCAMPISLATYAIGGRRIAPEAWSAAEDGAYSHEIAHNLISGNTATCDILLIFAPGTELEYTATQSDGKIVLHVAAAPASDVIIDSIQITRA